MAQFQDERTITEKSSDPLKLQHGEREEWQQKQQAWPKTSAPAFQTKETHVADDQRHDEHEHQVPQPYKKSMLRRVKDGDKTLIQKHGFGHGHDHREEEDHHQFEEEEGHDHSEQEEIEDTEGEMKEKAEDLNSNFSNRSSDAGSALSPGLDASSTRNLSNDAKAARDREVTNTGIQWSPCDPNVDAAGFEPRASSDRPPSPVDLARGQQELPTTPGQLSAGVTPTFQSAEATSAPPPEDDVQSDSHSDRYIAHQVHDIGTIDIAILATHPVQSEFSQELPNLIPYNRRKEVPENELYGKNEPEKIHYSDPFARARKDPEGMMTPIIEETAVETVPIQQAAEDRWFDADDVVAGAPTVKDRNPSLSHLGSEKFGTTEPISDELEYADQNKLGGKEIKRDADISDESQDLRVLQEVSSEKFNENTGRSAALEAATSIEGSKNTTAMDLVGTCLHASEKETERKDEEGVGDDESHMEKINGTTATENSANVASKRGNDEHQSMDEAPSEEDNYENSEEGKSYGDQIYDIDSTEKNEISSKLGYGEHQEPEQEETEKRTERPSADDQEGAHKESGKSLTDTPFCSRKRSFIQSCGVRES
jgi:hypothetical protein